MKKILVLSAVIPALAITLSGNLRGETAAGQIDGAAPNELLVSESPVAVFVRLPIDKYKKSFANEEDFYIVADDDAHDNYKADEFLKLKNISVINTRAAALNFGGKYKIDMSGKKGLTKIFFYKDGQTPKEVFPVDIRFEYENYFNKAAESFNKFEGVWRYGDGMKTIGGSLEIKNCKNNICDFTIQTANGAHTCGLDGTLTVNGFDAAAELKNFDGGPACGVYFRLDKKGIMTLKSNGKCGGFCGARGYFEGAYINASLPQRYKAGFDCAAADSPLEITICEDENLAMADNNLNTLYKKTTGEKDNQKIWLKERGACGSDKKCLADIYEKRLKILTEVLSGEPFSLYNFFAQTGGSAADNYFIVKLLKGKMAPAHFEMYKDSIGDAGTDGEADKTGVFQWYGVAGLYTSMEAAFYISPGQIWAPFLNYNKKDGEADIIVYSSEKDLDKAPGQIQNWIKNHKGTARIYAAL